MDVHENKSVRYEEIEIVESYDPNESFSQFIKKKQKDLNDLFLDNEDKVYTTGELANRCNIDYELFRKIINMQRPTQKRDLIIYICFLLILNTNDTNHALELYGMTKLSENYSRDKAILEILKCHNDMLNYSRKRSIEDVKNTLEGLYVDVSLSEINKQLIQKGFYPLYIQENKANSNTVIIKNYKNEQLKQNTVSDKRPIGSAKERQKNKEPISSTYINSNLAQGIEAERSGTTEKRIRWEIKDLFYDQYNSLITRFDPKMYHIEASIILKEGKRKKCKLIVDLKGNHNRFFTPSLKFKKYNNINKSKKYKYWFIELDQMITDKQSELISRLNDTRNYRERISARIINNDIHVFYEIYNYDIPELGEYYLMDYAEGSYTLHISSKSRFMQYYLTEQEYYELYGKAYIKSKSQYISRQEIENKIKEENTLNRDILEFHLRAYDTIKDKIDSLIDELKTGKAHIRNLEIIYDENPYEVLRYYKVADKFKCAYDPGFDEIDTIGVDSVTFTLTDGRQVDLSVEDLQNGFRLGLNSIDEIGSFLLEHNTLKIQELF